MAVDPVADVDDARLGRDPRHDAVAHAYELVVVAVVGQEGDHCRHRHGASLVVVAAARRPGSVSAMSDQPSTPDDGSQRAAARRARRGPARRSRGAPGGRGRARARARRDARHPHRGRAAGGQLSRRTTRAGCPHGRRSLTACPTGVISTECSRCSSASCFLPRSSALFALLAMWLGAESRPWFDERPVLDDRPNWGPDRPARAARPRRRADGGRQARRRHAGALGGADRAAPAAALSRAVPPPRAPRPARPACDLPPRGRARSRARAAPRSSTGPIEARRGPSSVPAAAWKKRADDALVKVAQSAPSAAARAFVAQRLGHGAVERDDVDLAAGVAQRIGHDVARLLRRARPARARYGAAGQRLRRAPRRPRARARRRARCRARAAPRPCPARSRRSTGPASARASRTWRKSCSTPLGEVSTTRS